MRQVVPCHKLTKPRPIVHKTSGTERCQMFRSPIQKATIQVVQRHRGRERNPRVQSCVEKAMSLGASSPKPTAKSRVGSCRKLTKTSPSVQNSVETEQTLGVHSLKRTMMNPSVSIHKLTTMLLNAQNLSVTLMSPCARNLRLTTTSHSAQVRRPQAKNQAERSSLAIENCASS
jgi:hypothetical protein